MRKTRILVTGATGFIGMNLVPVLLRRGFSVHATVRDRPRIRTPRVQYHIIDLREKLPVAAIEGVDAIVHLAGEVSINQSVADPRERIENNIASTLSVLEVARKSGKKPLVIFASTDRVYGRTGRKIVTETESVFPLEPYTASKLMCETMLATYAHLYDIPYIALRFDSVYGPHQSRQMFISDVIQKMLVHDQVATGPLTVQKNFVYVGDAVDAIVRCLTAPPDAYNQAYNIGGEHVSLRAIVGLLAKLSEQKLRKRISVREGVVEMRPSKTEVRPFRISTSKAKRVLGWRPKTSLKKGLEKTIEHFVNQP